LRINTPILIRQLEKQIHSKQRDENWDGDTPSFPRLVGKGAGSICHLKKSGLSWQRIV
jgi:hypothetical protein